MLKEHIMEGIQTVIAEYGTARETPENFDKKIENQTANLIERAVTLVQAGQTGDQLRKSLIGSIEPYAQAKNSYKAMHETYKKIIDLRVQEQWADIRERFRFLLFRILTAIGIAAVILGTGYIAHSAGIPLPLLRMV